MIDNEKTRKTPVLRFKGFTDDWEQRKLGEITEISSGQNVPNEDGGKYYNLTMGSVNTEGHLVCSLHTNRSDRLLVKGTLIMPTRDVGAGYVIGRTAVIDENDKYYAGNCLYCLSTGLNEPYYIHHYMNSEMARKSMQIIVAGGSQKQITLPGIKSIEVPICSIEEQRKIAQLFNDLDKTITLHQKKVFSLTIVKKSMLEKMFPKAGSKVPEIRFYGFTGDWEQRKLGELGKARSGMGFPDAEQGGKEGVPFYKVSDMNNVGNEHEMVAANNYVTREQIARKGWKPIDEVPAIFFAKVGAAVLLNRKRLCRFPFLLDNNTMAYSIDGSALDADFAITLFDTIDLTSLVQVGALPSYNSGDVENIDVVIPEMSEQRKIGDYFKRIDSLITLHQKELDKLLALKKSMLSEMFPK